MSSPLNLKSDHPCPQSADIEDLPLKPCVPFYGPINERNLVPNSVKYWCQCGLSKKQPWCDGSHKGTPFKPLKWTVPSQQAVYSICNCKYTKSPPYCDGSHIDLPLKYLAQQKECPHLLDHEKLAQLDKKMCEFCGFLPATE